MNLIWLIYANSTMLLLLLAAWTNGIKNTNTKCIGSNRNNLRIAQLSVQPWGVGGQRASEHSWHPSRPARSHTGTDRTLARDIATNQHTGGQNKPRFLQRKQLKKKNKNCLGESVARRVIDAACSRPTLSQKHIITPQQVSQTAVEMCICHILTDSQLQPSGQSSMQPQTPVKHWRVSVSCSQGRGPNQPPYITQAVSHILNSSHTSQQSMQKQWHLH